MEQSLRWTMSDAPPKSAVELAMEKLAQQDVESGAEATSLTEERAG